MFIDTIDMTLEEIGVAINLISHLNGNPDAASLSRAASSVRPSASNADARNCKRGVVCVYNELEANN